MKRVQHIVAAGLIAAMGLVVCWISFTQEPADAFLFPRLIAVFFVGFALWTFVQSLLGRSEASAGVSAKMFCNVLPGLLVLLIYVFWAAKALGFYAATAIAFFILFSLYDPASHRMPQTWARRSIITVCFVAVMYGLFAMLLKVYTPREMFL